MDVAYCVGDLLLTIGGGPGYVTAARRKFDRVTRYQYGSGLYPPLYAKIEYNTLVVVINVGERILNETMVQYEVMLPDGERVWIWGVNLSLII